MVYGDVRVLRIYHHAFHRLPEKVFWMLHHILVDRAIVSYKDSNGFFASATSSARLLPCAGNSAGISHYQARVQAADVNPKLQGCCADNAYQLTREELTLDIPSVLRKVSTAIRLDRPRQSGAKALQIIPTIPVNDLGKHSGTNKRNCLNIVPYQLHHEVSRLCIRTEPFRLSLIYEWWVPQNELLWTLWCSIIVD